MRQSQIAKIYPERIRSNVRTDDRLLPVDRSPARASTWSSFKAIDGATVIWWKAGSGGAPQRHTIRFEKKYGAKKPRVLLFDLATKSLQRALERVLANDHGQHLIVEQRKGVEPSSLSHRWRSLGTCGHVPPETYCCAAQR